MSRKLTTEEFIERARNVHGDRYDYSRAEYRAAKAKVKIRCPEHGWFEQDAFGHMSGKGCAKCGNRMKGKTQRSSTPEFIAKAHSVHGDVYDYSRTRYQTAVKKLTVFCREHGEFEVTPNNHLRGKGCPRCAGRHRTTEEFIRESKRVHGDRYDYSESVYTQAEAEIAIRCPEHGLFKQRAVRHMRGAGCPKCGGTAPLTTDDFIQAAKSIHGDRYDYSKAKYENASSKVTIVCPEHGSFQQTPNGHLGGSGCWECAGSAPKSTQDFIDDARAVHGDRYGYELAEYHGAHNKVVITCAEHGQFEQSPTNHLQGQGCPGCGETGFDVTKPAVLYYLRIDTRNQTVYKIGITNRTVKERFTGSDLGKIKILRERQYDRGSEALKEEQAILGRFATDRYRGEPLLRTVGVSEMFTRDVLGLDKSD